LIPSYPDLPMEEVYPRTPHTGIPMVFARERGKGRVVYFPMDLDRTFWEVLAADHFLLLRNAVAWTANEPPPLRVKGQGLLDVSLWKQRGSLTAHLVNLTNPMTMKGPYREIFPIGPLEVEIDLPAGARATGIKLLVAGQAVGSSGSERTIRVQVPRVAVHEVVAVDLA
jgi:hypothetical protein